MDEYVDCVAGIILDGSRFLVEKRREDDDICPGYVCLPAGHVDAGETTQDALMREMKEELNVDISDFEFVHVGDFIVPGIEKERIHYYLIKTYDGNIKCLEAASLYFESDIKKLSIQADRDAVSKLKL